RMLERARIAEPRSLAVYWAAPLDSLHSRAGRGALNRDDRPVVEYRAPRDLVEGGRTEAARHPVLVGRLPCAASAPARTRFSKWTAADWYAARVRGLSEQGESGRAALAMAAAREAVPQAAPALEALLAAGERHVRGRRAYDDAMLLL